MFKNYCPKLSFRWVPKIAHSAIKWYTVRGANHYTVWLIIFPQYPYMRAIEYTLCSVCITLGTRFFFPERMSSSFLRYLLSVLVYYFGLLHSIYLSTVISSHRACTSSRYFHVGHFLVIYYALCSFDYSFILLMPKWHPASQKLLPLAVIVVRICLISGCWLLHFIMPAIAHLESVTILRLLSRVSISVFFESGKKIHRLMLN